ncbi:PTS ascorbate transporter subunit IIC [Paenibacillus marchantiophytorum]|uniref:Ascorbate-specific PTS system EIIC component n=1 Tax=Paenibacillus marchantiophytorum TaxID=1619310 RepID=A0ABQ1EMQ9_9BACL|nr:PTS ascorbate transporter subunit IIC [Paenibacillus marchantiophytorum]GFZ78885.1 PTS ascorbate transporter subunit IIC [Paenibacillus marchantiophytorum]
MNWTQLINKGMLGEPAFLLGFIALLGLLLQRAPLQKIINGTIKTMLGYILLQIGASAAGSSLSNLSAIVQRGFQVIGIIPHNETVTALAQINYGQEIAIFMLIGMILHLCIARFTPIKYVFLTGHHMLFMASMLAGLLGVLPMPKWQMYAFGSLFLALSMSFGPAVLQPYVRRVTGGNEFAIGHFNSVGYLLAGFIATLFRSKEQKPASEWLKHVQPYFQDHMTVISVFTWVLFLVSGLFIPVEGIGEMFSGRHLIVVSTIQAVWFAAGVFIILSGVRMMLAEIIPAFHGIAEKVVPGAIPALDCPALFTYSPISAIVGFLLSFAGGLIGMTVLANVQYTIIIPGVIPHFFSGGAAGVIAYKIGGRRGLITASLCHGFAITVLPIFLIPLLSGLGFIRATFADSDFAIVGILVHELLQLIASLLE